MALLLKVVASFWDVDHPLTGVVGFSHPHSTEFHTLSSIDFRKAFILTVTSTLHNHLINYDNTFLKQTNINIMHSGIVNKTRYDDLGKPMKQTSFTVKNLGGNLPEKKFTIIKRRFRSSTKHLSLDSAIPVDELTVETLYHFKTSELFNI